MSNIFRAYDIRGKYPDELNESVAKNAGRSAALFLKSKVGPDAKLKIVLGHDARVSWKGLRSAVEEGIIEAGCDVINIGFCTSPLFYFSVNKFQADGGIMITASHNPPEYNGLKIVGRGAAPISAASGLKEIEALYNTLPNYLFKESEKGKVGEDSAKDDYVNFLLDRLNNAPTGDLRIVIDASNGMTPVVLNDLLPQVDCEQILINFEPDGRFPNHPPDTSKEENLVQLKAAVTAEKASFGVAFDGDGDRAAFVDENGATIKADYIAALIYDHFYKGKKVVYDARFSRSVKELFASNGVASKTGHSFMKTTLRAEGGEFGGELSGHFFYKEFYYADSAILTMLKVLEIAAKEGKPLSKLVAPFQKYFHSGEINIDMTGRNEGDKEKFVEMLKNDYADGKQSFIDGITVEYNDWWFNLRPSQTEPLMRLVIEADSQKLMDSKKSELLNKIKTASF